MLVQYFGFKQEPFGASPDPRCLYFSHTHREALASLDYGYLSNRGFTAMIAPPGMGKTTLLFRFLETIRESARVAFLFDIDSHCEPQDLVAYILRDVGIVPEQSSSAMHQQLTEALAAENRAGKKFVVVVDEAQNLSDAVLERIRLLTNFETGSSKLMQIVLSGQPSLADTLLKPSLAQLRQRIAIISRLKPLSAAETEGYIQHRLKYAGNPHEQLFTKDALALIAAAGHGIPRTINNLCFNALSLCCALKSTQVNRDMVSEVLSDLQLLPVSLESAPAAPRATEERQTEERQTEELQLSAPQKRAKGLRKVWVPAVAAALVMGVLGMLSFPEFSTFRHHETSDAQSAKSASIEKPVHAMDLASTTKSVAPGSNPNDRPLEVTVEPNQWLAEISIKHLGGYDPQRLQKIQALNPDLTDPNRLKVGQKILLPTALPDKVASPPSTPANVRTAP